MHIIKELNTKIKSNSSEEIILMKIHKIIFLIVNHIYSILIKSLIQNLIDKSKDLLIIIYFL